MSKPRVLPNAYHCISCDTFIDGPIHCGRPMEVVATESGNVWTCWKGEHSPCCGKPSSFPIDSCCDNPQLEGNVIDPKSALNVI